MKRQTTKAKWNRAVELQQFLDDTQPDAFLVTVSTELLIQRSAAMDELENLPNVKCPSAYEIID